MDGDRPVKRLQPRRQPLAPGDVHHIFAEIEHRARQPRRVLIAGQQQRPFGLQQERAGGHQRHDVVAGVGERQQFRGDPPGPPGCRLNIAQLQLRHAAAAGMDDMRLDAVPRQHGAGGEPGFRLVVIAEAGGVERGPAPEGGGGLVERRTARHGAVLEALMVEARQRGLAVDAREPFDQRAQGLVRGVQRPVGERRRHAARAAVAVGRGDLAVLEAPRAAPEFRRPVAQHQVREIHLQGVRRHIGAFGPEAHVAERARRPQPP